MDERPTQPILTAPGEMPDGAPSPDLQPPDRHRAQDLARSFLAGPPAQKVVGRAGCEEMARWIKTQPDWQAVIDEWLIANVAVERMLARGEPLSPTALVRLDTAERALAVLSSLDRRFADQLRRSQPALELDASGPHDVTDHEILAYARTLRDGTVTSALARQTCIVALGLGGPVADGRALARGKSPAEIIAQARTWCVVQIRERAEIARRAANPDPIDGPARYRPSVALDVIPGSARDAVAKFAGPRPRNGTTDAERIAASIPRDASFAQLPARIRTPRDDGSCAVCGQPLAEHDVDVDDGCPIPGARSCPAVAP